MNERDIQNAISEVRSQLNDAVGKRDLLNMKILNLEQNIRNLRAALTETRFSAIHQKEQGMVGLTEAIRTIFRRSNRPMTSPDVRMALQIIGFELERFANASSAVKNTLTRLAESGELEFDKDTGTYHLHPYADLYRSGMRGNEKPRSV
jgi:ribosomal protein L29